MDILDYNIYCVISVYNEKINRSFIFIRVLYDLSGVPIDTVNFFIIVILKGA